MRKTSRNYLKRKRKRKTRKKGKKRKKIRRIVFQGKCSPYDASNVSPVSPFNLLAFDFTFPEV
jgi:hypothetical protein